MTNLSPPGFMNLFLCLCLMEKEYHWWECGNCWRQRQCWLLVHCSWNVISKQWGMYLFNLFYVRSKLLIFFEAANLSGLFYGCNFTREFSSDLHRKRLIQASRFCSRKTDNCQVDAVSRTNCKKCRLKKCLAIGMKPEKVTILNCWALEKSKQGCNAS